MPRGDDDDENDIKNNGTEMSNSRVDANMNHDSIEPYNNSWFKICPWPTDNDSTILIIGPGPSEGRVAFSSHYESCVQNTNRVQADEPSLWTLCAVHVLCRPVLIWPR
jgi:hypothetical protein